MSAVFARQPATSGSTVGSSYGADCNITALVLNAIKLTKVDMQVYLGNYIAVSDDSAYQRQKAAIVQALKDYGADNVAGITVGESLFTPLVR